MNSDIIEPIVDEEKNLDLHVKLCAARYQQICSKFDRLDVRLEKIDYNLKEISKLVADNKNNLETRFLGWAVSVIGILSGVLGYLITHYVLR